MLRGMRGRGEKRNAKDFIVGAKLFVGRGMGGGNKYDELAKYSLHIYVQNSATQLAQRKDQ